MFKRIKTLLLAAVTVVLYGYMPAAAAESDLSVNAAEYICAKAKEGKKTRLAVYAFTNDAGETSSETKGYSTKIMALILDKKEFKVIDPEKVPEVISEQEKGLTGLVDPETAAETGKLVGADALVFGISGAGSLQVRIIDAATGEVIGATLEQIGGKTKINNEDFKSPEAKKKFIAAEFDRDLRRMHDKHPMLYLYVTANDEELEEMEETFPVLMKKFKEKQEDKDAKKNKKFEKRKRKLIDFRNENPKFDSRIRESRKSLMEKMKDKKRRK